MVSEIKSRFPQLAVKMNSVLAFSTTLHVVHHHALGSRNAHPRHRFRSRTLFSNQTMKINFPERNDKSAEYNQFADMLGGSKPIKKSPQQHSSGQASKQSAEDENTTLKENYSELNELLGPREGRFRRGIGKNGKSKGASSDKKDAIGARPHEAFQEIPEDPSVATEREKAASKQRAQAYAEMMELLGPPKGRFKKKETSFHITDSQVENETRSKKDDSSSSSVNNEMTDDEVRPVKKEAVTPEEEYALLETFLRGHKKSNKPRKGGRRFATPESIREGLVTEPWGTVYNLMPKKGRRARKEAPPKKGQKPFRFPDVINMSVESIEQSYWTLEKILDDEEADWQKEQNRIRATEEEKRKAKAQKKLLKKPKHPADSVPSDSSQVQERSKNPPTSNAQPVTKLEEPPRRPQSYISELSTQKRNNVIDVKHPEPKDSPGGNSENEGQPKPHLMSAPTRTANPANVDSDKPIETPHTSHEMHTDYLLLTDPKILVALPSQPNGSSNQMSTSDS